MARYAATTEVSPEKTRAEIERTLVRYGATGYAYGWEGSRAIITFKMLDRFLRYTITLPDPNDKRFQYTAKRARRSPQQQQAAYEQAVRQLWRIQLLKIKAKLEAIEDENGQPNEAEFNMEFMAYVVLPNGRTMAEEYQGQIESAYRNGTMPALLPGAR